MNSYPTITRGALGGSFARKVGLLLALAIIGQLAIVTASADAVNARWYLRNANSSGVVDITVDYGTWGGTMTPVPGDWNNDGRDTLGMFDTAGGSPATWLLRNSNTYGWPDITREYGLASGKPVVGNWRCEGDQTNVYVNGTWYLRRANGNTEVQNLGSSATKPVMGDSWYDSSTNEWCDTTAVHNAASGAWTWAASPSPNHLWNFYYGSPGDIPLMGDWDGDGIDSPGVYKPSTGYFYLSHDAIQIPSFVAEFSFAYGAPNSGAIPVAGDWDDDGDDTIGLVHAAP